MTKRLPFSSSPSLVIYFFLFSFVAFFFKCSFSLSPKLTRFLSFCFAVLFCHIFLSFKIEIDRHCLLYFFSYTLNCFISLSSRLSRFVFFIFHFYLSLNIFFLGYYFSSSRLSCINFYLILSFSLELEFVNFDFLLTGDLSLFELVSSF